MHSDRPALDLDLTVSSDRFEPWDPAWLDDEADLVTALRGEVPLRREQRPAPDGSKGLVEGVIIALGSAGAFKAAVDCLRAWLARDRTRRVELSWTIDGRQERIVLQGTAIPDEEFARLAALVRAKAGEPA